jgi:L-cysteine desulfidase
MKLLLALSFVAALAEEGLRGNYGLQVEKTNRNIGTIGSAGMKAADRMILAMEIPQRLFSKRILPH